MRMEYDQVGRICSVVLSGTRGGRAFAIVGSYLEHSWSASGTETAVACIPSWLASGIQHQEPNNWNATTGSQQQERNIICMGNVTMLG